MPRSQRECCKFYAVLERAIKYFCWTFNLQLLSRLYNCTPFAFRYIEYEAIHCDFCDSIKTAAIPLQCTLVLRSIALRLWNFNFNYGKISLPRSLSEICELFPGSSTCIHSWPRINLHSYPRLNGSSSCKLIARNQDALTYSDFQKLIHHAIEFKETLILSSLTKCILAIRLKEKKIARTAGGCQSKIQARSYSTMTLDPEKHLWCCALPTIRKANQVNQVSFAVKQ